MGREFRWNDWNREHATRHGVSIQEAEALVRCGPARHLGDNRYLVRGRGRGGRFIQVAYLAETQTFYIIHARPLTEQEKHQERS